MILLRYCCRLYVYRWALISMMSLAVVGLLERLNPKNTWFIFATKIPFHLHNMMPFLLLVAALTFAWHLFGKQEWWAVNGMGMSDIFIMKGPLLCAALLLVADATLLVPMGSHFFNPFQSKNTGVGVCDTRWRKASTATHHLFWRSGQGCWVVLAPKNDDQPLVVFKATDGQWSDQSIELKNVWKTGSGQEPQWHHSIHLDRPDHDREEPTQWHPLLLSIHDAVQYWWSDPMNKVVALRLHYWVAHIIWALGLVAWAPLLVVNTRSIGFRMVSAALSIAGSLVLYVGKEWIYAMSLPWSATYHPLGLWIIPLLTWAVVGLLIWERRSSHRVYGARRSLCPQEQPLGTKDTWEK